MTTETTYEPAVEKAIRLYQSWIREAIAANPEARIARMLEEQFPDEHYHTGITGRLTVQMKFTSRDRLVRVMRWLRSKGYRSIEHRDYPEQKHRTYSIAPVNEPARYGPHQWDLNAYFTEDATCKYVEVGTRTVPATEAHEVPVLELRCDGEALPDE